MEDIRNHADTQNPCHDSLCPADKACRVLEHKAVCMCTAACEASICLKDRGCPANQACRNFQCVDPCLEAECPGNTPCLVEDHTAICKFCPKGFVVDKDYGCLESGTTWLPQVEENLLTLMTNPFQRYVVVFSFPGSV